MQHILFGQDVRVRRNLRNMQFLYLAVVVSVLLLSAVMVFIWCRMKVVNIGYEISKASVEKKALIDKNNRLRIELGKLKSPERIERAAKAELGLIYPASERMVTVR
ncbi:MAG: cell division protein FtsL [Deltaproteobacteria bacterium]|jgi:cell division protein FtsL